jgi:DNA-binding response OmpR family regulator
VTSRPSAATVLVVDDDPNVTEVFARMLQIEGYRVQTAVEPESGLRQAEVSHPDAILLDLRMPRVDGVAFLRALRAHEAPHHTPVAIVTGDCCIDDVVRDELRELDAAVYFKPLWLEDLVSIAHELLGREGSV